MSRIHASAERIIDAEPSAVWAAITDYNGKRPQFLPENYREYRVERSPDGQDTVLSYTLHAGGRERPYQMQVEAATPGELLVERDLASTYTTHWQVERVGSGAHARVRLSSEWESRALGINGFFERRFAPMGVQRLHQETLVRLGQLLRAQEPTTAGR
ncbi:MAG TPA: SRPBCC family protein [Ktedonobacterales bacterium]|jgi:uncharacterized protein YndB with AHSA1/START domain|nr:SRPBCC family protein [Ktedonobacterales bacterium]